METEEELGAQVASLKAKLKSTQEDLDLAATIGKQLVETNNELSSQLESGSASHVAKIEALEQEKYSLQLELERLRQTGKDSHEELEDLRNTLHRQRVEQEERVQADHQMAISQLKKQINSLQSDMDAAQMGQQQAEEKNKQQEEMLREVQNQLEQRTNMLNETYSEEMAVLHTELSTAQTEKMELMQQLNEQCTLVSQLKAEKNSLSTQLRLRAEEVEEAQCQATSYCNTLERARSDNQELRVELDLIKMESQNQKAKGNSLFSEVEDKRVKAEKDLISLKVKNDALVKQLEISHQHLHKLKKQVSGLLLSSRGEADRNYIESLQLQLNQARNEVRELNLQKNKEQVGEKSGISGLGESFFKQCKNPTEKDYFGFLETLLEKQKQETTKVQSELNEKRMFLTLESEKVLKSERENFVIQKSLEKLQAQHAKLKMNFDELQLKYEPEKYHDKNRPPKRHVEILNFAKPSGNSADPGDGNNADTGVPSKKLVLKEIRPGQTEATDVFAEEVKVDKTEKPPAKEPPKDSHEVDSCKSAVPRVGKAKKAVSMSDDVDVVEYVPEKSDEASEASHKALPGGVRGRKRYHNVINVAEQKPEFECNQQ